MPASRMALEMRRVLERRRDDAGAQPERRVVGERQRLVVVLRANHRRHRAEDLLARDAHRVGRVGEQRRREIVALVRRASRARRRTRASRLRPCRPRCTSGRCSSCAGSTTGPMSVPCVSASSTWSAASFCLTRIDEAVVDALGDDQARRRRAALPGREVRALHRAVHRRREVGVVEDDQRILAAHLELHLGHPRHRLRARSRGRSRPNP